MFVSKVGDVFTTQLPLLGHGVNVKGNMSGGIARIIKKKHPEVFSVYKEACKNGSLTPGSFQVAPTAGGRIILNIASQVRPGANADIMLLESGLQEAVDWAIKEGHAGLAIPRIGSGIGGLSWDDVDDVLKRIGNDAGDEFVLEVWTHPSNMPTNDPLTELIMTDAHNRYAHTEAIPVVEEEKKAWWERLFNK